jgi:hypothetical protein
VLAALEAHEAVKTPSEAIALIKLTMEKLKAYEKAEDEATSAAVEERRL